MVGRRGKRGARSLATPATRSSRSAPSAPNAPNAAIAANAPAPRGRGRGRGRGRWANYWASRGGRGGRADEQGESLPTKRSRIIKFKLPSLRKLGLGPSSKIVSDQTDAADPAASNTLGSHPETPRGRRSKRAMAVPESSRTTRQSARLKPSGEAAADEASPSKVSDDADGAANDLGVEDQASSPEQPDQTDVEYHPKIRIKFGSARLAPQEPSQHPSAPATGQSYPMVGSEDLALATSQASSERDRAQTADEAQSAALSTADTPTTSQSPHLSRKRKSSEMKDESHEFESVEIPGPSAPAPKKLKVEEPEPQPTPASISQTDNAGNVTDKAPVSTPEDVLPNAVDLTTQAPTEGRGRGRGRGRGGRARGGRGSRGSRGGTSGSRGGASNPLGPTRGAGVRGRVGRGRGRGRGYAAAALRRGGKRIEDEIWDSDSRRRTPSPIPETQSIKDRAEELVALFKKVGQAQQLALSVLAEHSMQRLARDKNAYKDCPEYDQVLRDLAQHERKALTKCRDQYDLKVESAERVYAGNILIIEQRAKARLTNIQDEMFYAARGKYMELVVGRRAAEDDEHTETDGSDIETEEPRYLFRIGKAGMREVERGFFAESVRDPDGAAAHERGLQEWEDFVKKVRLGEDLNPQMQALDASNDAMTTDAVDRTVESLLQAARAVDQESRAPNNYDGAANIPKAQALSLLADTALSDPHPTHLPQMRTDQHMAGHRALFPQPQQPAPQGVVAPPPPPPPGMTHGPTDPRSFILPRPTPTQQPRRLLPARSPLGMGLPDPFAMNGPPQLPPPPGSNFHRLPLLSWPPGGQQPGPGHPGPGSAGSHGGPSPHGVPPSLYFPAPHGPPPPPPPPRRY